MKLHEQTACSRSCCIMRAAACMLDGGPSAQVASWGGYSFIINLLPIHCLASIFTGRLTAKLYIAYAPLIVLGTLEAGEQQSHVPSALCTLSSLETLGSWRMLSLLACLAVPWGTLSLTVEQRQC